MNTYPIRVRCAPEERLLTEFIITHDLTHNTKETYGLHSITYESDLIVFHMTYLTATGDGDAYDAYRRILAIVVNRGLAPKVMPLRVTEAA